MVPFSPAEQNKGLRMRRLKVQYRQGAHVKLVGSTGRDPELSEERVCGRSGATLMAVPAPPGWCEITCV